MTTGEPVPSTPNALRLMAELEFLGELCRVVASNTELQPILDWIVQKITSMFEADEGSIRLLGPEAQEPTLKTLIRKDAPGISSGSWPPAIAMNVMGYLMMKGEPLASSDLPNDTAFPGLRGIETRIRSVAAVPLRVENRFTGMLAVTQAIAGRRWKQDEIQLLTIVAGYSAGVIEQARLRAEALEKQRLEEEARRLERELGLAREIQMGLLPSEPLRFGPWEASGLVVPARQVGGDAFDYFSVSDGTYALAIADVSGKGIPAALLMSSIQASLRAFCSGRLTIPEIMDRVNRSAMRSYSSGKFVTFFYAEFEAQRSVLRYSNAGHNYPLLRRPDGSLVELDKGGMPLGINENARYEQGEVRLSGGDSLLLFSDGVPDAQDPFGQFYGEERLRTAWGKHGHGAPSQVIDRLLSEVMAFRGRADQSDDMTLVVLGAAAGS